MNLFRPIKMFFQRRSTNKLLKSLPNRPIEAYSANSGKVLHTFENPKAILASGYPNVLTAIGTSNNMAYGVRWRFQGENEPVPAPTSPEPKVPIAVMPPEAKKPSQTVAIEAVDPATGKVLWFPNINAAVNKGFTRISILKVLAGEARTHRGMFWRFWDTPVTPQRKESPEIAAALLTEAMKRDELARLRKAIFLDEARNEWGVRLFGRTLYRPTRHEAVEVWYANEGGESPIAEEPCPASQATLRHFLDERCELGSYRIVKKKLHNAYKTWAYENGYDVLPLTPFGEQLFAVSKNQICAMGGELADCYAGIRLKDTTSSKEVHTQPCAAPETTQKPDSPKRPSTGRSRPVESFDLVTGQIVAVYPSVRRAERAGNRAVRNVLAGKGHSANGLGWRYSEGVVPKGETSWSRSSRPFEAIDVLTGNVTRFQTRQEAKEAGFHTGSISDVLAGRRRSYAGQIWQYLDTRKPTTRKPTVPSSPTIEEESRPIHRTRADRTVATRSARLSRLMEAIIKMPKPWGPGTTTELNVILGDWYGPLACQGDSACSLKRYLLRIKQPLADQRIQVEIEKATGQNGSTYRITKTPGSHETLNGIKADSSKITVPYRPQTASPLSNQVTGQSDQSPGRLLPTG